MLTLPLPSLACWLIPRQLISCTQTTMQRKWVSGSVASGQACVNCPRKISHELWLMGLEFSHERWAARAHGEVLQRPRCPLHTGKPRGVHMQFGVPLHMYVYMHMYVYTLDADYTARSSFSWFTTAIHNILTYKLASVRQHKGSREGCFPTWAGHKAVWYNNWFIHTSWCIYMYVCRWSSVCITLGGGHCGMWPYVVWPTYLIPGHKTGIPHCFECFAEPCWRFALTRTMASLRKQLIHISVNKGPKACGCIWVNSQ